MKEGTKGNRGQIEMVKGKNKASSKFMDDKRIDSFSPQGRTCLFSAGGKLCCDIIPLCTKHAVLTAQGGGNPRKGKPTSSPSTALHLLAGSQAQAGWQGEKGGMRFDISTVTFRKINKYLISIYMKSPNFKRIGAQHITEVNYTLISFSKRL